MIALAHLDHGSKSIIVGDGIVRKDQLLFYQNEFPVEGGLLDERLKIGSGHGLGGLVLEQGRVGRPQEFTEPILKEVKTLEALLES